MQLRYVITFLSSILFSMIFWSGYTQEQYFHIINAYEHEGGILEEWKSPGKYSPINMFDNDINTCFAEGNDDDTFILEFQLETPITCDRIHILGGVASNDDLYMKNNRPKELTIWLCETDEDFIKDKILYKKKVILEDSKGYQAIQFDKSYTFKRISVQVLESYKGTKYDDTCITELKFLNNDVEIKPKDIGMMKKVYIQRVGERLKEFFKWRSYYVSEGLCEAIIDSKGNITWTNYSEIYWKYYKDQVIPLTRMYVKDSRLYVLYGGKEYVTQYQLYLYSERPNPSLTTSLDVYNIAGIEKNNLMFMPKAMWDRQIQK